MTDYINASFVQVNLFYIVLINLSAPYLVSQECHT